MRRYIEINGVPYFFYFMSGTVLSLEKHSTTHVSGSGGGGHISTNSLTGVSGSIRDVEISSVVVTERECWLKEDGGRETRIVFKNIDIPCRVGQRVAFIGFASANSSHWVSFLNFASMEIETLMSPKELAALYGIRNAPESSNSTGKGIAFLIFLACWIVGVFASDILKVNGLGALGFVLGVVCGAVYCQIKSSSKKDSVVESRQSNIDYFLMEYDACVKWALGTLSVPLAAADNFLTPEDRWQKSDELERQKSVLIKQRKDQGLCTSCGGVLSSLSEKTVGYCNGCRTA